MVVKSSLVLWMIAVLAGAMMWAEAAQGFPGQTSRILFFHVPQAWIATLAFLISMIASISFLKVRKMIWDHVALASAELGFLFCLLATLTGSLFAHATWGSYWNWDPRETSILILLMIYGAYFTLRSSVTDQDKKRIFSAVYAIIAFCTVPFLVFIVPRITFSLHPEDTMNPSNPGMDLKTGIVFFGALIAFTGVFSLMLRFRVRVMRLEQNLEAFLRE